MFLYREVRRRFTKVIGPVVAASLLGYFSYHLIQGNHGLRAYWRLKDELVQSELRLAELTRNRDNLKHHVALMKDTICPDLLDEQVRKTLGYSDPQEVVIIH